MKLIYFFNLWMERQDVDALYKHSHLMSVILKVPKKAKYLTRNTEYLL